jgi:DNA-binding transcriptional MocR family regulator
MTELGDLSTLDLTRFHTEALQQYEGFKSRNLKLDMTRGKPASVQLDLANAMNTTFDKDGYIASDGTDVRNYGGLDGLPDMKKLMGAMLGVDASNIIIGGNSSLQMMHDTIVRALMHGVPDGAGPWQSQTPKFLCPVPGYDRHFAICEHHGIAMIPVPMNAQGPDMAAVEAAVANDASIKGIWCVPKYSNPTGVTYSDAVTLRLARMKTAASDFRLFWDNAYAVHDLYDTTSPLMNVLDACRDAGHPNRPWMFASTSKISLAGGGIAAMASSAQNVADAKKHLGIQTIGPDKLNQLRHLRFFKDLDGIHRHMQKHAAIIRPKFEAVESILDSQLSGLGIGQWSKPLGGYFISLDTMPSCASRVVSLAEGAGVKLTPAGATFPYGRDPEDQNIRIAPTVPDLSQVELAIQVLATCVKLASAERLIKSKGT